MKTNTKKNFLKLAMTLMAIFIFSGAMAQDINHTGDVGNYVEAIETTVQTVGLGLKLYADPDPVYSPGYDGTGDAGTGINANSEWQWVFGTDFATGTEVKAWTAAQNWVELTPANLPAAGASRTYWVSERFGALGCANATGRSHTVNVIDAPTAVMTGANTDGAWDLIAANIEFFLCGENHQDDLTITFTEAGAAFDQYAYVMTATRQGYDVNDAPIDATLEDITATHGNTVAATIGVFVASPATFTIPAMTFLQDGGLDVRTKYEFTLSSVASRTSALSHARAGIANTLYTVADQTVTYWLNLPPVTGPIYHISNDFVF